MNIVLSRFFERQISEYKEPKEKEFLEEFFKQISNLENMNSFNDHKKLGFKQYHGDNKRNVYGIDLNIRSAERVIATFLHDYSNVEIRLFLSSSELDHSQNTIIFHRISEHDLQGNAASLVARSELEINSINPLLKADRTLENALNLSEVYSVIKDNKKRSILTEDKEELVNFFISGIHRPMIIEGIAGSGKTEILKAIIIKLSEYENTKKVLYITASQKLANEVSSNCHVETNNINFETLSSLLNKYNNSQYSLLDINAFEHMFVDGSQNNHQLYLDYISLKKKFGMLRIFGEINGLILGKYIGDKEMSLREYLDLNDYHSITNLKNEREIIYKVMLSYKSYRNNSFHESNTTCIQLLRNPNINNKYDYVLVDEVQDFTEVEFQFIRSLVIDERNIVISGDPNQTINPTLFNMGNITKHKHNELKWTKTEKPLKTNFRNSGEVTQFINVLNKLRREKLTAQKIEHTLDEVSNNHITGKIYFYTGNKKDLIRFQLASDVVEIVSDLNSDNDMLRVHDVKGLEFNHVIANNILSDYKELLDPIFSEGYIKSEDMHYYFNVFYVAISRVLKNLIIVEDEESRILNYLKDQLLSLGLLQIVDSVDDIDIETDESFENIFKNGINQFINKQYKIAFRNFKIIVNQIANYPNAQFLLELTSRALNAASDFEIATSLENQGLFELAGYFYKSSNNIAKYILMAVLEDDFDEAKNRIKQHDFDFIDIYNDTYTNYWQKWLIDYYLKDSIEEIEKNKIEILKIIEKIRGK